MVKTSIIIPVYNTAEYLKECFASVFRQTQKEVEIIAINDGSTDNSMEVLEELKREHPEIIIYSQPNQGLGSARNKGIELARGEFIYFLDSDDCIEDTALETCYQYAVDNRLDIVMFDASVFGQIDCAKVVYDRTDVVTDKGKVLTGVDFANTYWRKNFCPSACLIYTSISFIKRYHLRFLPDIYYEDNEFHIKIISLAERIMYIPQMLYRRRYRENSITTSYFDLRHAKDYLKLIQKVHEGVYNREMQQVIHEWEIGAIAFLHKKCMDNKLFENQKFAVELFEKVLNMWNVSIKDIKEYEEIEILYRLSKIVSNDLLSEDVRTMIRDRKVIILNKMFANIPLQLENRCVGIYGTGENTKRFMHEYREFVGEIRANLIFIDSNILSSEKNYENYPIYNVNDIGELLCECIVIASSKFESEMNQSIKERYGNNYKIIRLYTDLHFRAL